jgi:hypothetical protein
MMLRMIEVEEELLVKDGRNVSLGRVFYSDNVVPK